MRSCRRHPAAPPAVFTVLALATAGAQSPLLTPVAPPPAAIAWDAAERARNPMIVDSTFVRVDTAALRALPLVDAQPLGSFALDLSGRTGVLDIEHVDWTLGHRIFAGRLRGAASSLHLAVAPDDTVAGLIDVGDASYALAWANTGDVHVLQRIDADRLPGHMGCGTDGSHAVAAPPGGLPESGNSDCGKTIVDLLVCYTPRARQNAGSQNAIEAAIAGAVAQANAGHITSGVALQFRLVHMVETNYTELGSSTDLARFRNPSDGHMDEVHALRDTYGADLMHLITDPQNAQYCGVAYLMTTLSTNFASSAFGITVRTCIPNRTFTHECGHNMGCHHDIGNAGAALYPYSYGYRTPDNAFRTIMAYAPGTRINAWSSPNVVHQGYVMGSSAADNALTLENTRATVADFRPTTAPVFCELGGGVPGALGLPTLIGSGTINLARPLEVTLHNYVPNTIGLLVIGASPINVPVFGGTLVPAVDFTLVLVGNGSPIAIGIGWLASLQSAQEAWLQAAVLDSAAPEGFAASNALRVARP